MIKVMTILGTRPELIKMSCVIKELDLHTNHIFVHTGQNFDYELNQVFFDDLEIRRPDYFMDSMAPTPIETICNILLRSDELMEKELPDAILIYGDTNSGLAVISAKRRKIPIFHMEAGNRCFDDRVPEEVNRRIIDHTSDINLTITEHARRYLIAEGIRPETVIKVGSSMKEVLKQNQKKIESSNILNQLALERNAYFLISMHREENVDSAKNLDLFLQSMNSIANNFKRKIVVSLHPRTKKRLEALGEFSTSPLIEFHKPFGFTDYVSLQINAICVISDSGTITEEASILKFPAVTIRDAHERPEGMDEGTLIMSNMHPVNVSNAIDIVIAQETNRTSDFRLPSDYDVDNLSKKIVRIISSYIDYVNQKIWFKH